MAAPQIKTAIPKRRYQLGEFYITVLADIVSEDPVEYRYIMAVVTNDNPTPGLFLAVERDSEGTPWRLRLAMPDGEQSLGSDAPWGDLEYLCREGLSILTNLLDLQDEEPHRLL